VKIFALFKNFILYRKRNEIIHKMMHYSFFSIDKGKEIEIPMSSGRIGIFVLERTEYVSDMSFWGYWKLIGYKNMKLFKDMSFLEYIDVVKWRKSNGKDKV
jgi:hypothetical protein